MVYGSPAIYCWRKPIVSRILGRNRWPTVPGVLDRDNTTIGQATPKIDGANEEPVEQSSFPTEDNDAEVDDDIDDDNLDVDYDDDVVLYFRSINDILRTAEFAPRALVAEELHVVSSDGLTSFTEVKHNPSWRKVMMEVMMSIEENDTCSLIDLPPGCKMIRVMWVFKVKLDEHGAMSTPRGERLRAAVRHRL
jgi:hypothetical protein